MANFLVEFKGEWGISKNTYKRIKELIAHIKTSNHHLTGNELSRLMSLPPADVRHLIKVIREHASELMLLGEYLVAGRKGYFITTERRIIRQFMKKTHNMGISKIRQFNEAEKQLGLVDRITGI